jgi:hypothetical protein
MEYSANENAVAVKTGDKWILKPVCGNGCFSAPANAVAVRAGAGEIIIPVAAAEEDENAVAVRTHSGEKILVPIGCKEEDEGGCAGDDPKCEDCPCSAYLAETYTVALSGFPSICNVGTFNGSWTVTWVSDCTWQYDITAYHRVTLYYNGTSWEVHWRVTSPGGAYGHFTGTPSEQCDPTACTYAHTFCFEPMFCWNLCSGVSGSGTIVVS